jgi:hypothetical protein
MHRRCEETSLQYWTKALRISGGPTPIALADVDGLNIGISNIIDGPVGITNQGSYKHGADSERN